MNTSDIYNAIIIYNAVDSDVVKTNIRNKMIERNLTYQYLIDLWGLKYEGVRQKLKFNSDYKPTFEEFINLCKDLDIIDFNIMYVKNKLIGRIKNMNKS